MFETTGIFTLIGIITGILTGITGSSGVIVVVPSMTFLGHSFHIAVGTSLMVDVITTASVVYVYTRGKKIDWKIGLILGGGALVGAQIGSHVAIFVSDRPLEIVFALMALVMAFQSFRRAKSGLKIKHRELPHPYALGFLISLPIGILTGTLGTSGGIMFIAVMMILYSMDPKTMVGTATMAMFVSAISGTAGYLVLNSVDLIGGFIIGIVSLISGFYFAKMALKMKDSTIYYFLGSVFLVVSVLESITIVTGI
ncbi:MAG: sulfite exporter TauE/SafE family protein [Candidatus Thermoplasmatota archaeon]|nr:sulfite exporter TauE/SafE family protein [Candidatus Thermoplasmatota archaeon]